MNHETGCIENGCGLHYTLYWTPRNNGGNVIPKCCRAIDGIGLPGACPTTVCRPVLLFSHYTMFSPAKNSVNLANTSTI